MGVSLVSNNWKISFCNLGKSSSTSSFFFLSVGQVLDQRSVCVIPFHLLGTWGGGSPALGGSAVLPGRVSQCSLHLLLSQVPLLYGLVPLRKKTLSLYLARENMASDVCMTSSCLTQQLNMRLAALATKQRNLLVVMSPAVPFSLDWQPKAQGTGTRLLLSRSPSLWKNIWYLQETQCWDREKNKMCCSLGHTIF